MTLIVADSETIPKVSKGLVLVDCLHRWCVQNWKTIDKKSLKEDQRKQINRINRCATCVEEHFDQQPPSCKNFKEFELKDCSKCCSEHVESVMSVVRSKYHGKKQLRNKKDVTLTQFKKMMKEYPTLFNSEDVDTQAALASL